MLYRGLASLGPRGPIGIHPSLTICCSKYNVLDILSAFCVTLIHVFPLRSSRVLSGIGWWVGGWGLQKDFISIEDATGISTSEYGLLVGYGFSFFYVSFPPDHHLSAQACKRFIVPFPLSLPSHALVCSVSAAMITPIIAMRTRALYWFV